MSTAKIFFQKKNSQLVIFYRKITTLKIACQPEPNWPGIVTLMLSHEMKMSKLILLNFGAFVPGRGIDRHAKTVQPMTHGCQGLQCKVECIGAADEYWAQTVGSALIRLTVQGISLLHLKISRKIPKIFFYFFQDIFFDIFFPLLLLTFSISKSPNKIKSTQQT